MSSEKYSFFKSLGRPTRLSSSEETIKISPDLEIFYFQKTDLFRLVRQIFIDRILVKIVLEEKGRKYICSSWGCFLFELKENENGIYRINSIQIGIDFAVQKDIVTFVQCLDEEKKLYASYAVKFNEKLKLDFNDVSKEILKYFVQEMM